MDGKKTYSIVINGIKESADAVEALVKQLNDLDVRIEALNKRVVKVEVEQTNINVNSASTSTSRGSNASAIKEEIQAQKELNQLKKEEAAQQRLVADEYANTMKGMKQNLADLKTVINITDLGDTEKIKDMTKDASELTKKLKEMEQAYGQFGRNVGNYQDAANGFKGLAIQVGDTTQKFDNAKQALKELKGEMRTLSVKKDMGLISEEEVQRLKDLIPVVSQLESSIQDAGKPMDALMDTMQSFVAITQTTKGLGAFFGFDNAEIDKTIKNLVALQNAMQGLQTIQKQIQERQGIGAWIAPFNVGIDKATAKLLTFNTALLGTGKAAKAASVAIKGFSKALKLALSAGILIAVDLLVEGLMDLVENFKKVDEATERANETQKDLAETYGEAQGKLIQYKTKVDSFNGSKEEEKKLVEELNKEFGDTLGTYKSLSEWQDVLKKKGDAYIQTLINQAKAQAALNEVTAAYMNLETVNQKKANGEYSHWYQSRQQDAEAAARAVEEANKRIAKAEENLRNIVEENDKYAKEHGVGDYATQIKKNGQKTKKTIDDVEKEINQLRINAMKEGLNKTIIQLEEERKRRIAKLRENGQYYKNEEAEVNKIIDQQILDAKEAWAKKVEEVYANMWDRINDTSLENARKITKIAEDAINIQRYNIEESANKFFNQNIGSYGIQGKNQLSPSTQFSLGIASVNNSEFMSEMKGYIDLMREVQTVQNECNASYHEFYNEFNSLTDKQRGELNISFDLQKNYWEELKKQVDDYEAYLKEKYGEENFIGAKNNLIEESYSSSLALQFNQRISAIEAYWAKRKKEEAKNAEELYKQQLDEAERAYKKESGVTWNNYQKQLEQADKFYEDKLAIINQNEKDETISFEEAESDRRELEAEYQKAAKEMLKNYLVSDEALRREHNQKVTQLEQDKNNKLKSVNSEYYQAALQELRDFQTAQSNLEAKQPVINALGITNLKKTNENYKNLLESYETMANKIIEKRKQVNQDYQKGIIDKNVFDSTIRELDNFSANLGEKMDNIKQKLSFTSQFQTIVNDINQYMQQLGQGLNSMLSAIASYQDQLAQNTIDALEDEIDKQEDLLDKQKDIVESYKDAIDSIEDELATSRGDRRQHLIDQLNAEMEAQRRALDEQKKIEKEKQALEDKKKIEEKKRNEEQRKISRTQAIISGALAISNALAVQPFWVGLAMAALAATASAVQIATINAQKFASGGVIQGKSHAQGGVKVLGGQAEVEGGEFITNKVTTSKNVDILEYINAKKRRVNLEDFIDFYSSGKAKKNFIASSPRAKYADGGVIPTLNNEYQFDDRLLEAFERYSERPTVVSVVDINTRQAAVKNVQVLAGLEE